MFDGRDCREWPPDYVGMAGLCHVLQISDRQARRLLSSGKLPPADTNLTGSLKGRRWNRVKLLNWLEAQGPIVRGGTI